MPSPSHIQEPSGPDYFQLQFKALPDSNLSNEQVPQEELQKVDGSEKFLERCMELVSPEMVDMMLQFQQETAQVLHSRTEELAIFNEFSQSKYQELQGRFQKHTELLTHLRTDLEHVFRRIRALKSRIGQLYPEEMATVISERPSEEE
ncbi:hypothetical protein K493DRAFT_320257 [Basidiobolus meristosporus CBS 931.73]|uniref:KxDL domain-containing protein n=1 Tax=Basidiobolus meristosporus CBS 931.73 TaxID=1314790 RepID=A0A1Y1XCJ9_9FUNG|nr:hypothetical protein K493DRAFT_320257 [Basidiobolus meristosporus CBS 931.73]|eukprot:ORX83458.1 hypothetical protein K493DRAFT_320257 [Basidiobolus meristosporus CBS 931.73]